MKPLRSYCPKRRPALSLLASLAALSLFLPGALLAEEGCQRQQFFDHLASISDVVHHSGSGQPDPRLLFYPFDRTLTVGEDSVELVVEVNGKVFLIEEIELTDNYLVDPEERLATTTVEFLAAAPTDRERLRQLADHGEDVSMTVHLNGAAVESLTFGELKARSDANRENPDAPLPQALTTRLERVPYEKPAAPSLEPPSIQKYNCVDVCDQEQNECYLDRCSLFGSESCYNACDDQFENCLEGCGICQPSTTTSTTTTLHSLTVLGPTKCGAHPMFGPAYYTKVLERYKITTTTVTTSPGCTETTAVTITYDDLICWKFTGVNTCNNGDPFLLFCN